MLASRLRISPFRSPGNSHALSVDALDVTLVTKAIWASSLVAVWSLGYFTIGHLRTQTAFDPSAGFDAHIPFVGLAVWFYLFGVVWIALPVFLIRSSYLFGQTAVAYTVTLMASLLIFLLLPTKAIELRQQANTLGLDCYSAWMINALHTIDPPTNLLPSLHVSLATLSTMAVSKQNASHRLSACLVWFMVVSSVLFVKQHSITDVAAGATLAIAAFGFAGRHSDRWLSELVRPRILLMR